MKKMLLLIAMLALFTGCSANKTSMQDVRLYCRSVTDNMYCETQSSICSQYSDVTLRPYKSAKECRQNCASVRMKSQQNMEKQDCLKLYQAVENRCNEFCDSNYE